MFLQVISWSLTLHILWHISVISENILVIWYYDMGVFYVLVSTSLLRYNVM